MAAISSRPLSVANAARVAGGVVLIGIGALTAPLVLGLTSAVVLHTIRISAGRMPVLLLLAVHLFDIAFLVGLAFAVRRLWGLAGAHRPWW